MMEGCKRLILVPITTSICNLRCSYCYLTHRGEQYQGEQAHFEYDPDYVARALSVKRLGGTCYFNFCADGETLLTKCIEEYMRAIVEQGHYAEIVSNMTVTPVIDKICGWSPELRARTEFKASFHWLELKQRNLLETFTANVLKCWEQGISVSIEITPSDELVPHIDEVFEYSFAHFGAKPQLTIARDDRVKKIDYLTALTEEEYVKAWSQFDSRFWEFKRSIFGKKRTEYCYAGVTQLLVNIETGNARACYKANFEQNIFKNPAKPIKWIPIGRCLQPHCYNGHIMLTLGGSIPDFTDVKSGRDIRDRIRTDGSHWLFPEILAFFDSSACENNEIDFTLGQKMIAYAHNTIGAVKLLPRRIFANLPKGLRSAAKKAVRK